MRNRNYRVKPTGGGTSVAMVGKERNHFKYILEVVPACGVRRGYLLLGHGTARHTHRTPPPRPTVYLAILTKAPI